MENRVTFRGCEFCGCPLSDLCQWEVRARENRLARVHCFELSILGDVLRYARAREGRFVSVSNTRGNTVG